VPNTSAWITGLTGLLLVLQVHAQSSPGEAETFSPKPESTALSYLELAPPDNDTFYRLRTRSNYLTPDRVEKTSGRRYEDLLSFELFLAQHQAWSLHVGPSAEVTNFRNKGEAKSAQNLNLTLGSQVGGTYRLTDNMALSADLLQMKYRVIESATRPLQFAPLREENRVMATFNYKF